MAKSGKKVVYNHNCSSIYEAIGISVEELQEAIIILEKMYKTPNSKLSEIIEQIAENTDKRILTYAILSLLQTQQELLDHPFLGELNKKAIEDAKNK